MYRIEQKSVESLKTGDRVIYMPDAEVSGDQMTVTVFTVSEEPWVYRNGTYLAFNMTDSEGNRTRFYGWASDSVPTLKNDED